MFKKVFSILVVAIMLVSNFSGIVSAAELSNGTQSDVKVESDNYEIYPLPQKQTYKNTTFSITDEVNLVIEETIDESTKTFLKNILNTKSIKVTHSESLDSEKTNIMIGTKDSKGSVDTYFNNNITYDSAIFNEHDAYVLNIDNERKEKGTIAILGADSDAAYYALATLQMIFEQIPEKTIQSVKYEDYSDAKWRGFIEGFYGIPWSHEDRISLMRFGGKLKMNSYIFGPKDDQYHNYEWRKPYPADELAEIKELVDVGHESKTQFVWSIHPGMNTIKWDDYDKELDTLLVKLEQLYSVGVRQFGLFMDDISLAQSLKDTDKHVKLVTDVANWVKEKGDIKSLIYCPPYYNQAWTGEKGKPYLRAFQNVPENVEIMWTGNDVIGSVNTTDMQWVKDLIGRDSYVWLNWPVNGYKKNRLLLGKLDILQPGTHNISGVVSNPLEFAELSKVALFGVADYTWNVDEFNVEKSWQDSFKYVAPEVADELKTIAYHMSDPSPNGRNVVAGESENIKAELELFLKQFSNNESTEEVGNQLIAEFNTVLHAIEELRNKSNNKAMVEEIDPWLNCLMYVVESGKHAITSAIALQKGNKNEAWEELAKATTAMSESKKFNRKLLDGSDLTVEAGTKRLVPFAQQLMNKLDALIYTSIDPEAVIPNAISSYEAYPDLKKFVDGDQNTYVYIKKKQVNDDWYGVDLGKSVKINDIQILQGRNDGDNDIFHKGMLEYSQDGENWTSIGKERSGFNVIAKDLDIEARYVRYRVTHAGIPEGKPDLWTAVREFTVNGNKGKVGIYTNVMKLKETNVNALANSVEISNLTNITLKPSEYVGVKLSTIENIAEIVLESNDANLILESSENGVEWKKVNLGGPYHPAAYLRLMNQKEEELTFDLTKLAININKFTDPEISHNYNKVYQGKLADVFDGKLDTRVWFDGRQDMGRYVQVDMGGIVDIQNIAVVINDGEEDYFKKGDLQLSLDGKSWETVHSFNNPESRELNFPEFEAPYRYKRVQIEGGKQARYVRLYTTETKSGWLALNEILVNEGAERPGAGNNHLALKSDPSGDIGNEAIYSIDHKLSTFFTPMGDPKPGYLIYKLSDQTELSEIIILQNPTGISNAEVSVRDLNGWHKLGTLSQSYNTFNTSKFDHVLEIKLQWDGAVKPKIHEILPVMRKKSPVSGVEASPNSVIMKAGDEFQLSVSVLPESASNKEVTWTSSSPEIAEVNQSGLVKAISDGEAIVTVTTKDGGYQDTVKIVVDSIPPVTKDDAKDDWQQAATITLTSSDQDTGVKKTFYSVDNSPFKEGTRVTISDEGVHSLKYYSVDKAGNKESIKTTSVKIDKTSPEVTTKGALEIYQSEAANIHFDISDKLSGVASATFEMDENEVNHPIVVEPLSLSVGEHIIQVKAKDAAGNETTQEFILNVMIDIDHLDDVIREGYDKGWIENHGILQSLQSKVKKVQRKETDNKKVLNALNALEQQVIAQSGKHVNETFVQLLLDDIAYLKRLYKN